MDQNSETVSSVKGLINTLKLNGSKYENIKESKSLLAVFEQQLFVWHNSSSCVLTIELEDSDVNLANSYNVLLLTNPPVFDVECILFNRVGTFLALVGYKGVMILQVPWMSRILSSKNPIFCRSWHIAERFFICMNRINILQVAWHPGSLNCSHLVILSSDNYIRLYDVSDSQTPLQAIQISLSEISSKIKASFSASLGESAISFDFGPPESNLAPLKNKLSLVPVVEEELLHPIFVLHANGDVYLVHMPLKRNSLSPCEVKGPLAMYPQSDDNYGVDACSLICLHSNPPVLVIAMASGIIYHCLILDSGISDEQIKLNSSWIVPGVNNNESELALFVHGSIELPVSPSEELCDTECQPIRLYKDVTSYSKYHCSLVSGVHTVVTPFIQNFDEFERGSNMESLVCQLQQNNIIVEHLLCTRPSSSVKEVPVIGVAFAVSDKGVTLICLLASWEFVSLHLLSSFSSLAKPLLSVDQSCEPADDVSSESSFVQQIQQLCNCSKSTPLLKIHSSINDQGIPESQQILELLSNTTNRFREEYIDKLSTVHELINNRTIILVRHKQQQIQELEWHLKQREEMRNKAEQLAEKYEDIHANQRLFLDRIEKVMKLLQQKFPVLSNAEITMKRDLIQMEDKIKVFQSSLTQLKKKLLIQNEKVKPHDSSNKEVESLTNKAESLNLGETQLKHLKEILHQEGDSIAKLVKTISLLKKDVSV